MPNVSRTLHNNDNIKNALELFKDITSCLEDILKEPDDGSGKAMTQICIDHNIDYFSLRKLMEIKTLNKIYADKIIDSKELVLPEEDPYESLIKAVFCINSNEVVSYPVDLKESVNHILTTLTMREQTVIKMRFGFDDYNKMTFEEVGKEFKVTRDRIRQIEAKALRKLRHPNRSRILKYGLIEFNLEEKKEEIKIIESRKLSEKALEEYKNNIKKMLETSEDPINKVIDVSSAITIEELEFCVRTYNCLHRFAKLETLCDVLMMNNTELMKIRNFGQKSLDEVNKKLNEFLADFGLNRTKFLAAHGKELFSD